MESPSENSFLSETVFKEKDKLCSGMQNGQCHATFDSIVNTTDCSYLDSGPTTPLLSDRPSNDSDDTSEELCSTPGTDLLVLRKHDSGSSVDDETSSRIALQVFFPYLIAGFGMVGAGAVLEIVKVKSLFSVLINVVVIAVMNAED